jgi:hypothetical protein
LLKLFSTALVDWIKALQALRKMASALLTEEQSLEKIPKTSGACRLSSAYDEDGAIRMIQDAARQIAHDVMANYASRLRRTGHDQIVITLARFSQHLIQDKAVAHVHFRRHAESFEFFFLCAQIYPQLRV